MNKKKKNRIIDQVNISKYIAQRSYGSFKKSFTRSILNISIAATGIGLSVIILSHCIFSGFKTEIESKVFGFWGHIHVTDIRVNRSIEPFPMIYNDSIRNLLNDKKNQFVSKINHFHSFVTVPGILSQDDFADGLFFKGIGQDFDWKYFQNYIKEGSVIKFDSSSSRDILISAQTAQRLSLKVKDKVTFHFIQNESHLKRKLNVVGIYKSGLEEYDRKFALVDRKLLQEVLKWKEEEVTGIELFLQDISQTTEVCKYMYEEILPSRLYAETIREKFPSIFDWLSLQDINKVFILGLVLIVCLINLATMLLILILERTHMIGVLSTLGMSIWNQQKIFLQFAMRILFRGIIIGNLIGLGLAFLQKKYKFIKLSEQDYYLSYAPIEINLTTILVLNLLFFLFVLSFLIIPSYFIAKIKPIEALKFR